MGEGGFILAVAIIFLVVVLTFALTFVSLVWVYHNNTIYRQNLAKAVYLAEAGIENKLLKFKLDLVSSAGRVYDAFNEEWAQDAGDTNGVLTDSEGITLGDGTYQVIKAFMDGGSPPDSFRNFMDEQGKININYVETNYANGRYNSLTLSNLLRMTNGALSKTDAITKAENIVSYRYGSDGKPGVANKDDDCDGETCIRANGVDDDGVNGIDDAGEAKLGLEYNGVDDDGDGTVDEAGEGIDEPDEFNPDSPYGDDNPFDTIEEIKKVTGITETDYNNIKDYITIYSGVNSNSPYANNTSVSGNYKVPYALAPRITRSAVPRAPVNLNTASLPVLKVVLWNEDVTLIGAPEIITLAVADSVARDIMDQRNGADNLHGTSDDNPFDSISEFESFIDTPARGLTAAQGNTIKDNANPSPSNAGSCDYDYGYNCYTTEFFFFFTEETNEDIIDGYDCSRGEFYFTSKAFLVSASSEITGTAGAKANPTLSVVVKR